MAGETTRGIIVNAGISLVLARSSLFAEAMGYPRIGELLHEFARAYLMNGEIALGIIVKGVIRLYQNGVQAEDGAPHLLLLIGLVIAVSSLFAGAKEYEKTAKYIRLVAQACWEA